MPVIENNKKAEKSIILSERTAMLREMCIQNDPEICPERALIITRSYKENENKQINIKRALALGG